MSRIAAINHDRAFKELLTTFFIEFVAAFLPDVLPFIEPASIEFWTRNSLPILPRAKSMKRT